MKKGLLKFLRIKGFTLVELIIVIAIIAILSVVAFMIVTKWVGKSKDSARLADLSTLKKALEITLADKNVVPMPDNNSGTGYVGSEVYDYVGEVGSTVIKNISNMTKIPKDPADPTKGYVYGVTVNGKKYEVSTVLENGDSVSLLGDNVYADNNTYVAKVMGNFSNTLYCNSSCCTVIPELVFIGSSADYCAVNTTPINYVADGSPNLPYSPNNVVPLINDTAKSYQMAVGSTSATSQVAFPIATLTGNTWTGGYVALQISKVASSSAEAKSIVDSINTYLSSIGSPKTLDTNGLDAALSLITFTKPEPVSTSTSSSSSSSSSSGGGNSFGSATLGSISLTAGSAYNGETVSDGQPVTVQMWNYIVTNLK